MIALLMLAQQGEILELTVAATTADLLLFLYMGTLVMHTQLSSIDIVKRALGALIVAL